jgi:prophage maintenance system killer protein
MIGTEPLVSIEDLVFLHVVASGEFGNDEMLDRGILEAALRRPLSSFAGELLYGTPFARAAAVTSSLMESGRARLALMAGAWWLEREGYRLEAPADGLYAIASLGTADLDRMAEWLEENAVRLDR